MQKLDLYSEPFPYLKEIIIIYRFDSEFITACARAKIYDFIHYADQTGYNKNIEFNYRISPMLSNHLFREAEYQFKI